MLYENETQERLDALEISTKKHDMYNIRPLLETVEDCYLDFVIGTYHDVKDHPERVEMIKNAITENPHITTSDICLMMTKEIMGY